MSEFLLPLKYLGICFSLSTAPFLFLPEDYFKSYFKKIFWWLAPIYALVVFAFYAQADLWFDKADIATGLGVIFGLITLGFIALHYWRKNT
jgi:hypothetical protein